MIIQILIGLACILAAVAGCAIGEILCRLSAEPVTDKWDGWDRWDGLDVEDRY